MSARGRGPSRAFAAIAGATAVLAACLTAGPLFLSTAATAATRIDLTGRCPGLVAANLTSPYAGRHQVIATFGALAPQVPHAGRPIVTDLSTALGMTLPRDDGVFRSALVAHRTDGLAHLDLSGPSTAPGVYVPDWFASQFRVGAGRVLGLQAPGARAVPVPVLGVYRDVGAGKNEPFWCPIGTAFQTNQFDDHKPPVLIFDDRGAAKFRSLFAGGRTTWELPLAGRVTAAGTAAYVDHLGRLRRAGDRLAESFFGSALRSQVSTELQFVVQRATAIRSYTGAGIAPVRGSGALTGVALVLAAALLFVRRNRRELRIRVLRGTHPAMLGVQAAARAAPAIGAGAVAGTIGTAGLIRAFGPSSDLDSAALASAARFAGLAVLATLAVFMITVTVATRAFDRSRAPHGVQWRYVPIELVFAAVSFLAFRHLVDTGGVKLAGAGASRIDPWAVLFPLILVWTVLVALGRPLFAVLQRARHLGARARPAVMLGLRRAVSDPVLGVVTSGAVAFCLATFVYASALSTSIEASLQAKAHTFVGADLRIAMTSAARLDPVVAQHATLVTRGQGSFAGSAVTVLGIDPETFARIAFWRRSFGPGPLDHLLASLPAPSRGPLPVLVAGAGLAVTPTSRLAIEQGPSTTARVVGEARLWPSMQSGETFVVTDRAALEARGLRGVDEVWLRGLPGFVPARLASPSAGVMYSVGLSSVLDFNNALPVRWSLGLLGALGAVAGIAFAAVELAIVDSRARARQLAYLIWRRMGLTAGQHRLAGAIELGVPAAIGAVAAVVVALATVRVVIAHLDALASLPPAAGFVLTPRPFVLGGAVVLVVLATLVGWSQRVTRAGDPVELIRVAE